MDTVILQITGRENFKIKNRSLFWPILYSRSAKELTLEELNSGAPYLRRFSLRVKQGESYIPKVEVLEKLSKDWTVYYILRLEFSVPKLLYWNSLQEITEKDFSRVLSSLKRALELQKIFIGLETLKNAEVTAIHGCKNVLLPKEIKMRDLINELGKLNVNKAYDVSVKQHKNGGRVLNFYSGSIERSIYDKISDAFKPKNKRIDKEHIKFERTFVEIHDLKNREVFRYEYRLKRAQAVRARINILLGRESKAKVIFKDLFSPGLMKTLTCDSWNNFLKLPENQVSLFAPIDHLRLLLHMLSEMKKIQPNAHAMNKALTSFGLTVAIQKCGAKEVRGSISDIWNTDHPERVSEKIELASKLTQGLPYSNNIAYVNSEIQKFETITKQRLEYGI